MPKETNKKNNKVKTNYTSKKVSNKNTDKKVAPVKKIEEKKETFKKIEVKEKERKEEKSGLKATFVELLGNTPFVIVSCIALLLIALLISFPT